MAIHNLVPNKLQGKTAPRGKTPYEVLAFGCPADYEGAQTEAELKRFIVAKFGTYGDATLYAYNLHTAPVGPPIIIVRA